MTVIKIPYLVAKPGRKLPDGSRATRFFWQPDARLRRAGWLPQRLSDDPLTAQREAQERNETLRRWREEGQEAVAAELTPKTSDKSLTALIARYRASRLYAKVSPYTKKKQYDPALLLLEAWAGEDPVKELTPEDAEDLFDPLYQATPAKARSVASVLSIVLNYGQRLSWLDRNIAKGFASEYKAPKGVIWPRAAVTAFAAKADQLGMPSVGDAVLLNEWCGQRKSDLLGLGRNLLSPKGVVVNQAKGREYDAHGLLEVHLIPHLVARFEEAFARQAAAGQAATTAIVKESNGQPYTYWQYRDRFDEVRAALAEEHPSFPADEGLIDRGDIVTAELTFMHLRHTAVTRLAEAGVEVIGIAAITGHSPQHCVNIIDRYLVRTRALAAGAFRRRLAAEQGE